MSDHVLSMLTICGLAELDSRVADGGVTDVLSLLDPDMSDPAAFTGWPAARRTVLRFNDEIDPGPGIVLAGAQDIAAILAYGRKMATHPGEKHLLVHCHMGMSRSTAAMAMLLAQAEPETPADSVFERVHAIRPRSWPNSLMVRLADEALRRDGEMVEAVRRLYGRQLANFPTFADSLRSIGRGAEVDMAIAP